MPSAKVETNGGDLVLGGVPFISARARSLTGPAGQFLFAELFPNPSDGQPLPPAAIALRRPPPSC